MTHQPKTAPPASKRGGAGAMAAPTAVHALVFLSFGLVTVFWQEPTLGALTLMLVGYLLAYGAATFYTSRTLQGLGEGSAGQAFTSLAFIQVCAGVLLLLLPSGEFWLTLVTALALGLSGLLKLLVGLRAQNPAARDWRLEGGVITIFAAALPLVSGIGYKAIMGTAGAGALVAGVFVLIGALTLRAEGRRA